MYVRVCSPTGAKQAPAALSPNPPQAVISRQTQKITDPSASSPASTSTSLDSLGSSLSFSSPGPTHLSKALTPLEETSSPGGAPVLGLTLVPEASGVQPPPSSPLPAKTAGLALPPCRPFSPRPRGSPGFA